MTFEEALSYLLSLGHETLTIKLGLENTKALLHALGDPQKNFPAVQIAGTNGKGSTAAMLDSICRAGGIRTGLFTSPHLVSITERFHINGTPITEFEFAQFTAEVKAVAEELVRLGKLETVPTFFEHVTAIALLAFRAAAVELAILETGLGGRLDSTTAAGAEIVAITPIAMDHQEYLGETLEEIAAEKAAIIRPGVTFVVGPQTKEALDVILESCRRAGMEPPLVDELREYSALGLNSSPAQPHAEATRAVATITSVTEDGRCRVNFRTSRASFEDVLIGLRGRHQVANAVVAVSLTEALTTRGFVLSNQSIVTGLETVSHAGRLESWHGELEILLDGAHNPAAAGALRAYLDEFIWQPITMIFGAMRDKDLHELAAILFPMAQRVILTEIDNPRAAGRDSLERLTDEAINATKCLFASSPAEALRRATEVTPRAGVICVTGSLYLVGEVRRLLIERNRAVASHRGAH